MNLDAIIVDDGGRDALQAFVPRDLVLPDAGRCGWEDVYACWFGGDPIPFPDYTLWYGCPPQIDEALAHAFSGLHADVVSGRHDDWDDDPKATLAKLILVDQLSRHIFRGLPEAFAHDPLGRSLAGRCLEHLEAGHRYHIEEALIMTWPWIHSESLEDLEWATQWLDALALRADRTSYRPRIEMHRYGVRRHYDVIARFGRYPHRNPILGRTSTLDELRYLREERPMWGLDQWKGSRGGTWRYRMGMAKYVVKMLQHMIRRGDVASALALGRTLRPGLMFAKKKVIAA